MKESGDYGIVFDVLTATYLKVNFKPYFGIKSPLAVTKLIFSLLAYFCNTHSSIFLCGTRRLILLKDIEKYDYLTAILNYIVPSSTSR